MYNEAEKQQNLFNKSHRVHFMPLVIHALWGRHAYTHTTKPRVCLV